MHDPGPARHGGRGATVQSGTRPAHGRGAARVDVDPGRAHRRGRASRPVGGARAGRARPRRRAGRRAVRPGRSVLQAAGQRVPCRRGPCRPAVPPRSTPGRRRRGQRRDGAVRDHGLGRLRRGPLRGAQCDRAHRPAPSPRDHRGGCVRARGARAGLDVARRDDHRCRADPAPLLPGGRRSADPGGRQRAVEPPARRRAGPCRGRGGGAGRAGAGRVRAPGSLRGRHESGAPRAWLATVGPTWPRCVVTGCRSVRPAP